MKVQVTEPQPAMDTKLRNGGLKGKSPSSKVKDEYKVHKPEIRSKCPERSGMDLEIRYSSQMNILHLSAPELLAEGFQGSSPVIHEYSTTSAVLGMCDTHCAIGEAGKQMIKLDEESDMGHVDNQTVMGKAMISAQLESKSNLRMTNLMSVEKSLDTKVCSGDRMIHSQPAEVLQDQGPVLPVKERQVYIP